LTVFSNQNIVNQIADLNTPPYFETEKLKTAEFNTSLISDFEYKLPKMLDSEGDFVNIELFLPYELENVTRFDDGTIYFENITKDLVGEYSIQIVLFDDHMISPLSTEYTLEVLVIYSEPYVVPEPEEVIIYQEKAV